MNPVIVRRMLAVARAFAGAAAVLGCLGLLGYMFNLPALISVRNGYRGMSALTATGLIAIAIAIVGHTVRRDGIARGAAIVAVTIGVAALTSYALTGIDALSPYVAETLFGTAPAMIGRTSIATALAILSLGVAVLTRRARTMVPDILAGAALVLTGTALLGYLYGVSDLYALPMFHNMAVHTAIGLLCLAIATLCAEPEHGWATVIASDGIGGGATRRQLAFTLLPVVAGWVLLRTTDAGALGPAVAMALLVVLTIVPLALLVLRDGQILDDLDAERRAGAAMQDAAAEVMALRLAEQAAQLGHESGERTKAEAAMYRAQRMEAVGQLTGGIAHDFNNLLMAIRGNMELLQRRMPPDEKGRRYLDNAVIAIDKGAKLTGQLLAFSRSQRLAIRAVELDPLLVTARELIGNSLGPTVSITLDLGAPGAWISTDPDQLELAILNIAVNARDAMPEGGTIRIESRLDEAGYIAVRIVDDGDGMSADVLAKAVEPFFTTKERGKGTGLGLAQVYGFVRQCDGDLRIVSEPGEGTTIELLLRSADPIAKPAVDIALLDMTAAVPGDSRPVLVIDDDAGVRGVIVEALRDAGFAVVEAADGTSGLALLDTLLPAAAVIDFLMPGMNGAEVARRAQIRLPGLPIVFVSGYSDTVALEGIAGAVVLRKPFDIINLQRAVSAAIH